LFGAIPQLPRDRSAGKLPENATRKEFGHTVDKIRHHGTSNNGPAKSDSVAYGSPMPELYESIGQLGLF